MKNLFEEVPVNTLIAQAIRMELEEYMYNADYYDYDDRDNLFWD